MDSVRIDKWLWATRVYKTRALAASSCDQGKVEIGGFKVKPSRSIRVGETIIAQTESHTRTVRVLALLDKRIGASLVPTYLEDLTPASEKEKQRERPPPPLFVRTKGTGRPTKKDRRLFDRL